MEPDSTQPSKDNEENSLEQPSTVIEPTSSSPANSPESVSTDVPVHPTPDAPHPTVSTSRLRGFWQRFNIYLLGFIIILIIAAASVTILIFQNQSAKQKAATISVQNLSQAQLERIANNNVSVGNPNQVLNIGSSAIFSGQVLARQDLDVAGAIKVGSNVNATSLTISGATTLGQTQTAQLAVVGTSTLQGQVVIGQTLTVNGAATFGGAVNVQQITAQTLKLNGDLILNHHIQAGGSGPGHTNGSVLGNGGTASVGGSDTAGTVNINTGSSPQAGCFINITFSQAFNATPHIVITPVGSASASVQYYITRSPTNFSICSVTTPPASQSLIYDYIALD